jgi:urease accessory protein
MHIDNLAFLQLMQLADSALPIGTTSHSFGLETLAAEEGLNPEQLASFLRDYLNETGELESIFCHRAYRLASTSDLHIFATHWLALNERLSAFKTARESRVASATLGRRFLQLVGGLEEQPVLQKALQAAKTAHVDIHYSTAFGLIGSILEVDEMATVLAYLQQILAGLVSACQRLMPLGQSQASQIMWRLKPTLIAIANRSDAVALDIDDIAIFVPLPDLGSMRHPALTTRLFIS